MVYANAWSIRGPDDKRALPRLRTTVEGLIRQKRRQLYAEYGGAGLFVGLCLATVAVVIQRLSGTNMPTLPIVCSIVLLALAAAILRAWKNLPDNLSIVIEADIHLKLKQRLSTAWECVQQATDVELSQQLAAQAMRQRYPPPARAIFPITFTTWARLVPVALLMLVLAQVVDLQRLQESPVPIADDVVVEEGARLREFAQQMRSQAERENLPRSKVQAEEMRRLGARMEGGSLSRERALSRLRALGRALRDERSAAYEQAGSGERNAAGANPGEGSSDPDTTRLREMLEQILQGDATQGDLSAMRSDAAALSRTGISGDALRQALERFSEGEPGDLEAMVRDLAEMERAAGDAEALERARQRVDQVRENLGDLMVAAEELMQPPLAESEDGSEATASSISGVTPQDAAEQGASLMERRGLGHGAGVTARDRAQTLDPQSERQDVAIKAQAQFRPGEGFTTEARVLPSGGQVRSQGTELEPRFVAQMEEVLAKEQYPLHHKEFIRRYFMTLSRGVTTSQVNDQEP